MPALCKRLFTDCLKQCKKCDFLEFTNVRLFSLNGTIKVTFYFIEHDKMITVRQSGSGVVILLQCEKEA